jgi:H+/Cl- antiporter ClcA
MTAGIVAPVALVGMLVGVAVAVSFNVEPGSVSYVALVAGGFAGMMASTMNVPIAGAIMAVEVFGLAYSVPAGLAAVIGFQINRHRTIYELATAHGRSIR